MSKKKRKIVTVNDKMQKGYRYELTEPAGRVFDMTCRPKQRQVLLHWAYDGRKI